MTTSVLTVSALDLGADRLVNYMKRICNGFAVAPGRVQVRVKTPATLDPSMGENVNGSIYRGAILLDEAIRTTPGPKIVLGYSQGAQVASTWLRLNAYRADAPPASELSFIFCGNPERRYGQKPKCPQYTPEDTRYAIRDLARPGDNFADHQGDNTALLPAHLTYWDADPFDPRAQIQKVVGNTNYVLLPPSGR